MNNIPILLALALLPVAGLRAQSPAPSPTPSVSTAAETHHGGRRKEMLQSLTPEEREKLKAARQAALEDPAVKAAEASRETDKRGYRQALRAAMLRKDPSVGEIFAKMKGERKQEKIF